MLHKIDVNGDYIKNVITETYPEVLIGTGDPTFTFRPEIDMDDFAWVKSVHGNTIWKSKIIKNGEFVFIRKDLLKNYPELIPLNIEDEKTIDRLIY